MAGWPASTTLWPASTVRCKDYLTDPARMKRFYTAVRGRITSPGPARPVFRANTDMMLLTTRLRVDANGKPHIPGSLEVWKNLFVNHPQGKYDGKLTKLATSWKEPDDVLEALFALCRKAVENEPLKIFMAISDIDRNRATPLERRHGGPPGARVSQLRQPVPAVQRIAQLSSDKTIIAVPGHGMAAISKVEGSARCTPISPARSRRWSACGRFSCGSRAFPRRRPTRVFAGIVGGFADGKAAIASCSMPGATA